MSWALCNMEQQSRSNATIASDATNATNNQAADKTSSMQPVHIMGLLDLNRGAPSPSLSGFSAASVAESVEFTETNPAVVIDKEAPASEEQAPLDSGMPDAADESEMQEISTGGALADPMQEVCHLLLLRVSHCPHF